MCDTWPDLALIGCTTDGELSSRLGFRQDSVVLVLFGSDRVEFTVGIGQNLSEDVAGACSRAVDAALADATQAPAICLTLPESLTCSGQAVVEALSDKLGGDVPVFGATSGDGYELLNTYQFCGREIFQDSIPVLVLSGPLVYSAAVASGWEPLGEPGVVTRSDSTLLIEIDGRPLFDSPCKVAVESDALVLRFADPAGEVVLKLQPDAAGEALAVALQLPEPGLPVTTKWLCFPGNFNKGKYNLNARRIATAKQVYEQQTELVMFDSDETAWLYCFDEKNNPTDNANLSTNALLFNPQDLVKGSLKITHYQINITLEHKPRNNTLDFVVWEFPGQNQVRVLEKMRALEASFE